MQNERQRQEEIARRYPYPFTQVFECEDGEVFRAVAFGEDGARRVLNAERPGMRAKFVCAVDARRIHK